MLPSIVPLRSSLCKEGTDAAGRKVAKCDWTQLKAVARPGTYCLGTYCAGSVKQDPKARDQVLVQAYPKCKSWGRRLVTGSSCTWA